MTHCQTLKIGLQHWWRITGDPKQWKERKPERAWHEDLFPWLQEEKLKQDVWSIKRYIRLITAHEANTSRDTHTETSSIPVLFQKTKTLQDIHSHFPKKNRCIFAIADMYGQKAKMEICTLAHAWTHVQSAWWCSFCKMPSENIFCLWKWWGQRVNGLQIPPANSSSGNLPKGANWDY